VFNAAPLVRARAFSLHLDRTSPPYFSLSLSRLHPHPFTPPTLPVTALSLLPLSVSDREHARPRVLRARSCPAPSVSSCINHACTCLRGCQSVGDSLTEDPRAYRRWVSAVDRTDSQQRTHRAERQRASSIPSSELSSPRKPTSISVVIVVVIVVVVAMTACPGRCSSSRVPRHRR